MTDTTARNDLCSLVDRIMIPHTAFEKARSRIVQCFRVMQQGATPFGLAIIGESRTGKSTVLKEIELAYPPTRDSGGRKVPFLRATVPSAPKVKGLASLLLYSLGDPAYSRGSEVQMTLRLQELLERTETKILALDEFQHFQDRATHKVQHEVADWLTVLVDESKISLVVTGLPNCLSVIAQNEQLAGRFAAHLILSRFDWTKKADRDEFAGILYAFRSSLSMFDFPALESEEMAFRFYCASGGLIGYVVKILKFATWTAVADGQMKIGLPELDAAAREAVVRENSVLQTGFNPFDRAFKAEPTEDLLTIVRAIGTPLEESPRPRRHDYTAPQPKVSEVLVAGT